jgi:hypothetical protein
LAARANALKNTEQVKTAIMEANAIREKMDVKREKMNVKAVKKLQKDNRAKSQEFVTISNDLERAQSPLTRAGSRYDYGLVHGS